MRLRRDGRPDGRSKHATFQRWLREHAPLAYLGLYAGDDEVTRAAEFRRRRESAATTPLRRAAAT
jgi:hypothetical protein